MFWAGRSWKNEHDSGYCLWARRGQQERWAASQEQGLALGERRGGEAKRGRWPMKDKGSEFREPEEAAVEAQGACRQHHK